MAEIEAKVNLVIRALAAGTFDSLVAAPKKSESALFSGQLGGKNRGKE